MDTSAVWAALTDQIGALGAIVIVVLGLECWRRGRRIDDLTDRSFEREKSWAELAALVKDGLQRLEGRL